MQNNTSFATPVLKLDGSDYNENVDINSVTSSFIEQLLYKGYKIPKLDDMLKKLSKYDIEITLELKDSWTEDRAKVLVDTINYYRVKVIVSGMLTNQVQPVVDYSHGMDVALIFQYTDSLAQSYISEMTGKCRSLRFDCYYSDVISKASVAEIVHPNYKIKLGGSNPARSDLDDALVWADVCETNIRYSDLINL